MGVLFDYFAAPSDEAAVATIDRIGGPGGQSSVPAQPAQRRGGWFRRAKPAPPSSAGLTSDAAPVHDTVSLKGIDPVVMVSTLEAILTGVPYDTIVAGPRAGQVLDERDGGERLVVALTHEIQNALASATDDRITRAASDWLRTEEFATTPGWSEGEVTQVLRDLAGLARRATERHDRLYCWICV